MKQKINIYTNIKSYEFFNQIVNKYILNYKTIDDLLSDPIKNDEGGIILNNEVNKFEIDYRAGNMDFGAYCKFLLNPLIGKSSDEISLLVDEFINEYKEVLIDALSYDLLERHKNDRKIIASGSLNFIVKGFSKFFSIDTFLQR